jgi:hypothetical protein
MIIHDKFDIICEYYIKHVSLFGSCDYLVLLYDTEYLACDADTKLSQPLNCGLKHVTLLSG